MTKKCKIFIENKESYKDLERQTYVVNQVRERLAFMIEQNLTDWPQYKQYQEEAKQEEKLLIQIQSNFGDMIKQKYLTPREILAHWTVEFGTQELEYTIITED